MDDDANILIMGLQSPCVTEVIIYREGIIAYEVFAEQVDIADASEFEHSVHLVESVESYDIPCPVPEVEVEWLEVGRLAGECACWLILYSAYDCFFNGLREERKPLLIVADNSDIRSSE